MISNIVRFSLFFCFQRRAYLLHIVLRFDSVLGSVSCHIYLLIIGQFSQIIEISVARSVRTIDEIVRIFVLRVAWTDLVNS